MAPTALLLAAATALALAPQESTIDFRGDVTVNGRIVRLGQVADLSALPAPLRTRAEVLEVARLSAGGTTVIDTARLAARARAQLPALAPWMRETNVRSTVIHASAAPSPRRASKPPCVRLEQSVSAGEFLLDTDVTASDCATDMADKAIWLDRAAGAVRASRDLAAGEVILAPPAASLAQVRPGQTVRLTTVVGPVALEREVEVSRPARGGAPIFVQGSDGVVFTAPPVRESRP